MATKPQPQPAPTQPRASDVKAVQRTRNELARAARDILKHWRSQPFGDPGYDLPPELHEARGRLQEIDGFDLLRLMRQNAGCLSSLI